MNDLENILTQIDPEHPEKMVSSLFSEISISWLVAGLLFSVIGFYFFKRARQRSNTVGIILAVALLGYSYFVTDALWVWIVGILLTIVAYKTRW